MDITSLFSIASSWTTHPFATLGLLIDGIVYQVLAYSYKLFTLMCQLNYNSLYGLISPLVSRAEAVIIVIIMYKVGVSLIQYLLDPSKVSKEGKKLITNIFIAAALLVSYNFIFGVMNELSMLIIGTSDGMQNQYTYLSKIAGVESGEDTGLINRFIFGETNDVDAGEFIALETLKIFVIDLDNTNVMENTLREEDPIDFMRLEEVGTYLDKSIKYIGIVSTLCGIYLIYSIAKCAIQIGIRMFKLMVLQLFAPIAIISIIADGTSKGKFPKYCKMYLQVYLEAFTRIASMLIVTVLIAKFLTSIDSFFGITTDNELPTITKGLLTAVLLIAGYKFASEAPKFIDQILDTHLADAKGGGFGSFLGGLVGGGIGAASGLASGIASGAGFGGTIANMAAGGVNGLTSGAKGKNISERIKSIGENSKKNYNRSQAFARQGGIVASGINATEKFLGIPQKQQARESREKDTATAFDNMIKTRSQTLSGISSGVVDGAGNAIKYGNSADEFASKAVEYDASVQSALAAYESTHSITDRNAYITARDTATKRYKDQYNSELYSNATVNADRSVKEATLVYDRRADKGYTTDILSGRVAPAPGTAKPSISDTRSHYQGNINKYQNKGANQRDHRAGSFGGK